jgi:hypothetical protein
VSSTPTLVGISNRARPRALSFSAMAVTSARSSGFPPTESQPFSGCDTMTTQNVLSDWQKTQQAPMPGTCLRLGVIHRHVCMYICVYCPTGTRHSRRPTDAEDLLEVGLDLAERDVLAALELDEVLLAVDDAQHAVAVHDADVARVEPDLAVGVQHKGLRRLLGQLVVAVLRHVVARHLIYMIYIYIYIYIIYIYYIYHI